MVDIQKELKLYRIAQARLTAHLFASFAVFMIYMALTVAGAGEVQAYIMACSVALLILFSSEYASLSSVIKHLDSQAVNAMKKWEFNRMIRGHYRYSAADKEFCAYKATGLKAHRNHLIGRMTAEFSLYAVAIVYGIYNMIGLIK